MNRFHLAFFTVILGIGLLFGGLPSVFAAQEKEYTLEEIRVVAEKRVEDAQKTAMEISVISGDEISTYSMSKVSDVLESLAGVKVMGSQMGGNIFIRGIGSGIDTNMSSPSVSLQKDNVYLGQSEAVFGALYDVDHVEVLYGPQGTMYGRNAAGGQVNVITKNPSITNFESSGDISLGTYKLISFNAILNVPFSSTFAARLAINSQTHDGYISDGSGSANRFSSRIKLLYKPTDKVSFLMTGDFTWDKSSNMNSVPIPGSAGNLPPSPGYPLTWADLTIPTTGWVVLGGDAWTNDVWHPAPVNNTKYKLYSLQVDLDMGWSKLTLIPTFNRNFRGLWSNLVTGTSVAGMGLFQTDFIENQRTFEARLANGANSPLIWTVGTYWYKAYNKPPNEEEVDFRTQAKSIWDTSHLSDNPLVANYEAPKVSYAAFGQATYPVTDKFRVVGGVRYNQDNNNMKMRIIIWDVTTDPIYTKYYTDSVLTTDGRHEYDSGYFTYTIKSKPLTYKGGLEYDLDPTKMLYANITTGFKAGGLNRMGFFPPIPFDPEKVRSYSAGIKSRWMANNTLQLNAEAYYYDYTGYQVQIHGGTYYDPLRQAYIPTAGGIANAKKGTNYGLDVSMDWIITAHDRLNATLAYMRTKFGQLLIPSQTGAGAPTDLAGTDLPKAPHLSGTLGYEHLFNLEDGGTIAPKFQTKISEGFWNTSERNLVGCYTDSYIMSDFYLIYTPANGKYSTVLWVKNIENSIVTDFVFPLYRRLIMAPRTLGVTFSINF